MEKHVGIVNWFHDKTKDANYGFINHAVLGELFFHEKGIEQGQIINDFKENEVVIFVSQVSKKHTNKLEATHVKLLSTEIDIDFLLKYFLFILKDLNMYRLIHKKIYSRIIYLFNTNNFDKKKDDLFVIYQSYLNDNFYFVLNNENILRIILNICKDFFNDNYSYISKDIASKASVDMAHKFWLEGYIDTFQVEYISKRLMSHDESEKIKIFERFSQDEKSNILFKLLEKIKINADSTLDEIKNFLSLLKSYAIDLYDEFLKEITSICTSLQMLNLWLEDYHQELNFSEYKIFTITLNPVDQKKFVKKTLKYIHEGKAQISIEELTSINLVNYKTSKSLEKDDDIRLDYSTSIILNTILELRNQTGLQTRRQQNEAKFKMFDIILNQIKEPTDILEIEGYFDICEGRMHSNGTRYEKPKGHTVCDGRIFLNTEGDPVLDENNKKPFLWCANKKCFESSIKPHHSNEWEKYTLLDFLIILKIDFIEKDFEIYLNIINTANRFLKHLKCRECNHILRPLGKSNYAFYGVTMFNCTNQHCNEKGNKIYLSHCLNGKCGHDIDSRDSAKCKPEGVDSDKYGWYVCNYCYSCCTTEKIQFRIENLKRSGQVYKGHTVGHRDLGIICCDKCGTEMESNQLNIDEHKRVLDWFIKNRENGYFFDKWGQKNNGKYWFRFKNAYNLSWENFRLKLQGLMDIGFDVPNIDEKRSIQLVSEPNKLIPRNKIILACKKCETTFDLSTDPEKAAAIRYFHKNAI